MAVDTGPAVVNRKAARSSGRNAAERDAIVIDRFFDTKQKALAWANAHPHFMTVGIQTPGPNQGTKLVATKGPRSSPTNVASSVKPSRARLPNPWNRRVFVCLDQVAEWDADCVIGMAAAIAATANVEETTWQTPEPWAS